MSQIIPKKIKLRLVDAFAFSLMATFQRQAREQGWSYAEIDVVLKEAMSGDHDHLLRTLADHCQDGGP